VARYREYFQNQTQLLSISLTQQIQPGTIGYTISQESVKGVLITPWPEAPYPRLA
jgi:hypothetical protein